MNNVKILCCRNQGCITKRAKWTTALGTEISEFNCRYVLKCAKEELSTDVSVLG